MLDSKRTFIIAELSANHGGDIEIAIETVLAAKRAGADAIKLQTYTADTITLKSYKQDFKVIGTHWDGLYLYDLYKEASLPWDWHARIFQVAKECGLVCFSSPFDNSAVDLLESLGCPIYKIASLEITDIGLLEYVASKGKPVIMSTGIATIEDIELAVETCRSAGNDDICILKCTSEYPASPGDANLLTIPDIASRFGVKSGLSDHTIGVEGPIVAVALGGTVIEKHFILNKSVGGPDSHFSLDEMEFKQMVDAIRIAEKMLGVVDYELTDKKIKSRSFSRSLYVVKGVKQGEVFNEENVRSIRPGYGLHPKFLNDVLGKKAKLDVEEGTAMQKSFYV